MGLVDMTFWGAGLDALTVAWPPFIVFSAAQVGVVRRLRTVGAPGLGWTVLLTLVALVLLAVLGIVSQSLEMQWAAREGLRPRSAWARTTEIVQVSTGPTLWVFVLSQV